MRARRRPSRTARVRLPARRSVSMSRTLLTTRIAAASSPTGIASANASHSSRSCWTKYDPTTATMPFVNIVIGVAIFAGLFALKGTFETTNKVAPVGLRAPAKGALQPGDRIVTVDGRRGGVGTIRAAIARHRCAAPLRNGCVAATPARLLVERDGHLMTLQLRP